MKTFDLIWIGTGQATGTVLPQLVKAGKKVAVIEKGQFGGSCLNYGCTPTKTLVASARVVHMARRALDFGLNISSMTVDFAMVMKRMNDIRIGGSEGMESWIKSMRNVEVFHGTASFIDDKTVKVGDTKLVADDIVIHTGAVAGTVPIAGLEQVPWLSNVELLDLKELPKHLIIIGGSYIGLEFGQLFRRLGSKVTILEASPQIMFREDADIAEWAKTIFEKEGINVYEGVSIERIERTDEGVRVYANGDNLQKSQKGIEGSHLLLAVGRKPAISELNLSVAGVETDKKGYIKVDDTLHTSVKHIYALGDVNGSGAFTHTSVNDGEIFLDNYLQNGNRKLSNRITIYAMFTDPPLGRIGMSEKEAVASGRNVLMATRQMKHISRAREKAETDGMVKILVDADTREFLGVSILGTGGDEIINMFAPLIRMGVSCDQFRKAVMVHPTVAELMPWILDNLKAI